MSVLIFRESALCAHCLDAGIVCPPDSITVEFNDLCPRCFRWVTRADHIIGYPSPAQAEVVRQVLAKSPWHRRGGGPEDSTLMVSRPLWEYPVEARVWTLEEMTGGMPVRVEEDSAEMFEEEQALAFEKKVERF